MQSVIFRTRYDTESGRTVHYRVLPCTSSLYQDLPKSTIFR